MKFNKLDFKRPHPAGKSTKTMRLAGEVVFCDHLEGARFLVTNRVVVRVPTRLYSLTLDARVFRLVPESSELV